LVNQLLATLTQSQNAAEFNANWQRIYAHFDVLFTTEASIDALKQTLLQLAVMGKLVPQNPIDEPASELLKRIQAEKAKLIAEGKLKKEKPLAPIREDEKPFILPKGWEWSKVLDCSVFVTDGEHATPQRTSDGKIPLVTAKNVRDGYMDYEDTDFVDIYVAEKCWKRCKPEQSDLLMVSVGATLGRLTMLEEARDMVIVRSVTLIRPSLLSPLYLSLAIKSPLVQEAIWGSVRQMAQPGLYLAQSSNLVIPIAPLAEQNRIVAKVDALMALCDQLKTRIQQANQQQQAIADALVAQAVA
jgi:type I restriction enzyme, S subunit